MIIVNSFNELEKKKVSSVLKQLHEEHQNIHIMMHFEKKVHRLY